MKDLLARLNNIDIKDLLGSKLKAKGSTPLKGSGVLAALGKVDRSLWIVFAVGAILLVIALNILVVHLGLREQRIKLENDIAAILVENDTLNGQLRNLESKNREVLALMREAPGSVTELVSVISEDMQAVGVELVKSSTAKGPDGAEVIVFSVEGDYRPLRAFIGGLATYSASFEVNRLEISVVQERGVLVASMSLNFVRPPKIAKLGPAAYFGRESPQLNPYIQRVQFNPSTVPDKAPSAQGASNRGAVPDESGQPPDRGAGAGARNPFLVPPKPSAADGSAGSRSQSSGRQPRQSAQTSRLEGLVLTGCFHGREKASCVFETNDGRIIKARPGEKVLSNISLVSVSEKMVQMRVGERSVNVQIGDQIK